MHAFFYDTLAGDTLRTIGETLALLVPVLIGMAYATYFERKALGAFQLRRGPNRVGPFGLWQPFADAVKVFTKETVIPAGANRRAVPVRADADLHAGLHGVGRHSGE